MTVTVVLCVHVDAHGMFRAKYCEQKFGKSLMVLFRLAFLTSICGNCGITKQSEVITNWSGNIPCYFFSLFSNWLNLDVWEAFLQKPQAWVHYFVRVNVLLPPSTCSHLQTTAALDWFSADILILPVLFTEIEPSSSWDFRSFNILKKMTDIFFFQTE